MKGQRRRTTLAAIASVVALLAAACGSGQDDDVDTNTGSGDGDEWVAVELLRTLPADGESLIGLTFVDIARAEASIDLERPSGDVEEENRDWLSSIGGFGGEQTAFARDGKHFAIVAYVHDSPSSAEANVTAVQAVVDEGVSRSADLAWSELYRVEQAYSTGSISVAILDPLDRPPSTIYQAAFTQDSLFWAG